MSFDTLFPLYTSVTVGAMFLCFAVQDIAHFSNRENTHSGSASHMEPEALLRLIVFFWILLGHSLLAPEGGPRQPADSSRHLEGL